MGITNVVYLLYRCSCQYCQVLPTRAECVCCHQVPTVSALLPQDEDKPTVCITERRGFDVVCLDVDVLDVAWLQYKQQYGRQTYDGPLHKRLRHVAYRQFVRWCYRYLGKDIRVILPSCVVSKIRAFFPPPGLEETFTFEGFHFD